MDGEMRARGARKGRHNGGDFDAARNMLGKVADAHSLQAEDGGGGAEGVLSLLRSAIELFPDCERSSLALSMCDSVKTDNCGGATMSSLVSAAARASQDASGPLDDLCLAVFWSGKRDQALIYAECAVAIDPSSAPMLSTFACMLMRTGRTVEADDALAKILELHGSNVSVICDAAAAVLDADMERAIRMYEHALELDPSFPQALFQYAAIVLEEEPPVEKHLAKLRLYGTQAHRMDPSCIDTMMALGKLEQRGGGKKDAQLAFHRVLEMSPSHPAALYSLAQCEEKWGTLESTAEAYAQAMAACPSSIQVLSSHARWIELQALRSDSPDVKGRAHLVERAISVYTKILTIDPHDYNALFHLGIMHKSQQDGIRAAIGFFKQAIGADPSKASALSHLGALRIARDTGNAFNQTDVGHFISAMTKSERACWLTRCQMSATMLERALSIDPMDLVALSTLGWYHAYVKRDGKAAAPLISRAIQIAPRDPHLLTWYARAMTLMKEFAVAKEALDRASIIMMMNGGLTRDEAEEELEGQLQRKEDSDVTLRDSRLAGAKILDEEMFGKIDKRILNDEDWRTSIGTQGGTVFNVTSLRAKGLIKIETEEQERWFTNYISRHEGKIENYKPSRPSRKRLGGSHEGVLYISNQGVHDEHVDKLSRLFGPVPFAKKSKKVHGEVRFIQARACSDVAAAVTARLLELNRTRGHDESTAGDASVDGRVPNPSEFAGAPSESTVSFEGPRHGAASTTFPAEEQRGWAGLAKDPFGPHRTRPESLAVQVALELEEEDAGPVMWDPVSGRAAMSNSPSQRSTYRKVIMRGFEEHVLQDTVHIRNLGPDVDDAAFRNAMRDFGQVITACVNFDHKTGVSCCEGRVQFASAPSAQSAIEAIHGKCYRDLTDGGDDVLSASLAWKDDKGEKIYRFHGSGADEGATSPRHVPGQTPRMSLMERRFLGEETENPYV